MRTILIAICLFIQYNSFAQNAIAVSVSKIYFAGEGNKEQNLIVRNPDINDTLKIRLSFQDWKYDSLGNNSIYNAGELTNSLSNYLLINSKDYIILAPGATDTIRISVMNIPEDNMTVRTAMLYLTQLDKENIVPAAIKTLVQMGVKIYYKNSEYPLPQVQLSNFNIIKKEQKSQLHLSLNNTGNTWLDGHINYQLLNLDTGEIIKIGKTEFFSLPADNLQVSMDLPKNLKHGNYKAYAFLEPLTNNGINKLELTFTN